MMIINPYLSSAAPSFIPNAVDFDGANDEAWRDSSLPGVVYRTKRTIKV